ncbi:MAG: Asp-tRNA(Asn)/Glu-tRNA(Gln) amidotransferase subunit GatA [Spirochaetota bacterium]
MLNTVNIWTGVFSDSQKRKAYLEYVQRWEKKIHAFLEFNPERLDNNTGIPFAVKDNIAVKGFKLTCGSKILENLVSPYTATAVKRLQAAGAFVVGKTNLDEFGMGSSTENSALAVTSNPWDTSRVPGGSSGGSAAAVAAGLVPFALGSDTGGSIRQPASFCGVFGLKPTYGVVSRYGLVAYASSLEVIGVISKTVETAKRVFNTIKGIDPMDHSSLEVEPSKQESSVKRIGLLPGSLDELDSAVKATYQKTIDILKKLNFTVIEIELPTLEYVVPAYYTIAPAEASANLARYTGIRYGSRPAWAGNPEELVRRARDEGFGNEVKLRILLGTYVLRSGFQDQYYLRAQKIRTAIRKDFESAFSQADLIMTPVYPVAAFKRGGEGLNPFQQKLADKFTSTANLAGIPALAFPADVINGLPIGMQFMAPPFEEERLFYAASLFEKEFPSPAPDGYSMEWSR